MSVKTMRTMHRKGQLFEDYGIARLCNAQRNAYKRIARDLRYDRINPNIFDEIDRAVTEYDVTKLMMNCRHTA